MRGAPVGLCAPQHCPAAKAACPLPCPSMSLPLSLLPPTPERPDPCPGAGGPCLVYSHFPTKSFLHQVRGLTTAGLSVAGALQQAVHCQDHLEGPAPAPGVAGRRLVPFVQQHGLSILPGAASPQSLVRTESSPAVEPVGVCPVADNGEQGACRNLGLSGGVFPPP